MVELDEERARALVSRLTAEPESAAAHLASLAELLLPAGELIDNISFDLFEPVLAAHGGKDPACHADAELLLLGLAEAANARELFCLVMEGFRIHPAPPGQLLLLRMLSLLLPRIRRKRAEFYASALGSLNARFLEQWPGPAWEELEDDDGEAADEGEGDVARLVPALLACAAPLAVPPPEEPDTRRLAMHFLWRTLEASVRAGRSADADAAAQMLASIAPTLAEVEALGAELISGGGAETGGGASEKGGATQEDAADEEEDGARLLRPATAAVGAALYMHIVCTAQPDAAAPAAAPAAGPAAPAPPVAVALAAAPRAAQLALLAGFAGRLLQLEPRLAQRGRELLTCAVSAAGSGAPPPPPPPTPPPPPPPLPPPPRLDSAAQRNVVGGCLPSLLSHMATSPEQLERTASLQTLQRLLDTWPPSHRLRLARGLIGACPFPNVVALLLHRIKTDMIAARSAAAAAAASAAPAPAAASAAAGSASSEAAGSASGAAAAAADDAFPPAEVAAVLEELLRTQADPATFLDALMGALNLLRFLLALKGSAGSELLPAAEVARLRRDALEPLDLRMRRSMDDVHQEVQRMEREQPPPDALPERRIDFTRLHVAVEVLQRVLELCGSSGAAAA